MLRVTRNARKLRRGSHDGNRFAIRLRDCEFSPAAAAERWRQIVERGVPNYFGAQRFGKNGGNITLALRLFAGEIEVRDRLLRGLYISAARSRLFNACVAARLQSDCWDRVLPGEVFGFAANRSLVLPENLRGDEATRVAERLLEITAPLWGEGAPISTGAVRALEKEIATEHTTLAHSLETSGLRQERRVLRLRPKNAEIEWRGADLLLRFELPKGAYATTVLRELAEI